MSSVREVDLSRLLLVLQLLRAGHVPADGASDVQRVEIVRECSMYRVAHNSDDFQVGFEVFHPGWDFWIVHVVRRLLKDELLFSRKRHLVEVELEAFSVIALALEKVQLAL